MKNKLIIHSFLNKRINIIRDCCNNRIPIDSQVSKYTKCNKKVLRLKL